MGYCLAVTQDGDDRNDGRKRLGIIYGMNHSLISLDGNTQKEKRGSRYDQTTICLKRKYIETRAYHGRRRGSFRTYADRLKICHPRKNQERLVIYIHEGVM